MGSITDATLLHHVCVVLILLWALNSFNYGHSVAYFLSLIYIYLVHESYVLKLRKKLRFEEKRDANQRRVLSDSETIRWLNHAIDKIWLICMEQIVSQKILLPMIPWFLKKYKPWTAKDVEVQHLYLGRSPPIFTAMRVLQNSNSDDHLVLELGINFRTAADMSAILGVKLRKRLGFGMSMKLHLLGVHIEGKVLVGVKFLRGWPFISRLRVCFAGPPYFQMTVKPIFTHGLDVTELPGVAGWIDNLLALVFKQTLVEPNMLVVDVEKFVSPQSENWFTVDAKEPIAFAVVEVLEAADMKPSDLNRLADPYVKGQLGRYRFQTKTRKKTSTPKWHEEFKIPICTWDSQNILVIEVCDKDHLFDDSMGGCSVNINELRDGQRHDMWLALQNIKTGRVHLSVTISEVSGKVDTENLCNLVGGNTRISLLADPTQEGYEIDSAMKDFEADSAKNGSFLSRKVEKSAKLADTFEPVNIEGQSKTRIWIHHPGSEVMQVWEPRKGKSSRLIDVAEMVRSYKSNATGSGQNDGSSSDESSGSTKHAVRKRLRKIGSMFRNNPGSEDNSPSPGEVEPSHDNIETSNAKKVGVNLIIDNTGVRAASNSPNDAEEELSEEGSPHQGKVKGVAKSILKHAEKSARSLKCAFSRKGSKKFKSESGSTPTHSDTSDDDSLPPSADVRLAETGFLIPSSVVPSQPVSGYYTFEFNESVNQKDLSDNTLENGNQHHNSSFKSMDGKS